jgi:hypothetical protein
MFECVHVSHLSEFGLSWVFVIGLYREGFWKAKGEMGG